MMGGDPPGDVLSEAGVAAILAGRDRAIRALNSLPPAALATAMQFVTASFIRHIASASGQPEPVCLERFMVMVADQLSQGALIVPFVPDVPRGQPWTA